MIRYVNVFVIDHIRILGIGVELARKGGLMRGISLKRD